MSPRRLAQREVRGAGTRHHLRGAEEMIAPGVVALEVADLPANWRLAGDTPRGKYGNRKTVVDGITFDSAKEAARWQELSMLERGNAIHDLEYQVKYPLVVNGVKIASYVADFRYWQEETLIVEDVKSEATRKNRAYRIKVKLMAACYGITIRET